eukprot:363624-Chlamydomonas_euryale.AAC.3
MSPLSAAASPATALEAAVTAATNGSLTMGKPWMRTSAASARMLADTSGQPRPSRRPTGDPLRPCLLTHARRSAPAGP